MQRRLSRAGPEASSTRVVIGLCAGHASASENGEADLSKRRALVLALLVAVTVGLLVIWSGQPDSTGDSDLLRGEGAPGTSPESAGTPEGLRPRALGERPPEILPTQMARKDAAHPGGSRKGAGAVAASSRVSRGRVRGVDGKPINRAIVWWSPVHPTRWSRLVADGAGRFQLPSRTGAIVILPAYPHSFPVPDAPWNLTGRISADREQADLSAKPGERLTVRALGLDEVPGVVVDPSGVRVQIVCQSLPHPFLLERPLSSSAETEFGGIDRKEGRYVVFVGPTSDGRSGLRWIHPPIPSQVEVYVERAGRIAGRVEAPDPVLKAGVRVMLRDLIGFQFEVGADVDGYFEFEGVPHKLLYRATAKAHHIAEWQSEREACRAGDAAVRLRSRDR